MPLFLEPSAWARLYIQEEGTEQMKALFTRPDLHADGFFASTAVALEMYGRLAKGLRIWDQQVAEQVRRAEDKRKRRGDARSLRRANLRKYRDAVSEFERDLEGVDQVELTRETYERAMRLANGSPELAASAMDWLHLATAFDLSETLKNLGLPHHVIFVTADRPLKNAALGQGMDVFDPRSDEPADIAPPRLLR